MATAQKPFLSFFSFTKVLLLVLFENIQIPFMLHLSALLPLPAGPTTAQLCHLFVCYKEIEAKKYRDWEKMSTSKDQAALSTDTAKVFNNSPSYLFPETATPWTAQTSLNDRAWEIWQSLATRQAHRCVGWSWNSHLKHIIYTWDGEHCKTANFQDKKQGRMNACTLEWPLQTG